MEFLESLLYKGPRKTTPISPPVSSIDEAGVMEGEGERHQDSVTSHVRDEHPRETCSTSSRRVPSMREDFAHISAIPGRSAAPSPRQQERVIRHELMNLYTMPQSSDVMMVRRWRWPSESHGCHFRVRHAHPALQDGKLTTKMRKRSQRARKQSEPVRCISIVLSWLSPCASVNYLKRGPEHLKILELAPRQ